MSIADRYPRVTSLRAVWEVARFEGTAGPLAVLRDPAQLRQGLGLQQEGLLTVIRRSAVHKGRFVPRGYVDANVRETDMKTVLITAETLPRLR
jgi:hypothetical protein